MKPIPLPAGYEIRELEPAEFEPLWQKHAPRIFDHNSQIFRAYQFLSEEEKAKVQALAALQGTPYRLNLVVFFQGAFAGWCCGGQETAETFYMRNSAILPEHRRKGLYSALIRLTLEKVCEKGFQKIYSRHSATNNEVIIPKLKAGFTIASLEVSDVFGVLVHLVYFPKALRRKVMVYRVGDCKPDEELKRSLGI